ncbi:MAG TPA: hypothetical protein VJ746_12180 [Nitrospira sp.]|nr:hypothetical protein [Nitrospira sp.]
MQWPVVTLAVLFATLPGCMMVREGKVKAPSPWPPQQTQEKKSIALTVAGVPDPSGAHQMPRPEAIENARLEAVRAYTESGLFSSVVVSDQPTDLRADIALIEDGSDSLGWSGAVSALTFTMFPGYVSENVILKTNFTGRDKKVIDSIEKKEELGFWIQFFLLFAMPFIDSPSTVGQSAQYDIHRATIQEAHGRGIF